MMKLEKQRAKDQRDLNHMMSGVGHPNTWTLRLMEHCLFDGVPLSDEHLAESYRKIFLYLAQDKTMVHPSLRSLHLQERFSPDGKIVEAWLSLESDGTTDRAKIGERYRLTLSEVRNLWMLVYPYNVEVAS